MHLVTKDVVQPARRGQIIDLDLHGQPGFADDLEICRESFRDIRRFRVSDLKVKRERRTRERCD